MVQCTGFPAGVVRHTSKRQKDLCLNGLRNTIRTNGSLENNHRLFQSTVMRPAGHYPLWDEVKFIDRDPYWYTRKVKEGIHISLYPDNINGDSGSVDAHDQRT